MSGLGSETHYKAVCRALVAEALELSSFLDKLSDGSVSLRHRNSTSAELITLDYSDWVSYQGLNEYSLLLLFFKWLS